VKKSLALSALAGLTIALASAPVQADILPNVVRAPAHAAVKGAPSQMVSKRTVQPSVASLQPAQDTNRSDLSRRRYATLLILGVGY
jgi:hypothetical protein